MRVPPLCCGQPAMLVRGVRRVTHCAAAQLRSNKRGESVHEAGVSFGTPATPRPALLGTHRREPGDRTAIRAIAALGLAFAARGACARETGPSVAMARGAARLSTPCWLRLRRGGCGVGMRVGARMLRERTRRGCSSAARQRVASSTAHPASAPPQVCPGAQRRGRRLGGAFSLVTFFWRSKRKLLPCRGHIPASPLQQSTLSKMIATSATPISARPQKHFKRGTQ